MIFNNKTQHSESRKSKFMDNMPSWQKVYRKLELHKIANITTYQVNGNLFIVVPIEETVK